MLNGPVTWHVVARFCIVLTVNPMRALLAAISRSPLTIQRLHCRWLQVETVEALISEATKAIDKATAKGIIHKNTAARRKSRMARAKHAMVATLQ